MDNHPHTGADHAKLSGVSARIRYRPERLQSRTLSSPLSCTFRSEGLPDLQRLPVVDLGPTGMGIAGESALQLAPGTRLLDVCVSLRDQEVWRGEAAVVHQTPDRRIGVRFTSGAVDVERVRLSDSLAGESLVEELREHQRLRDALPPKWRAGVTMVRQLLERARDDLEAIEARWSPETRPSESGVRALVRALHRPWVQPFYEQLLELDALSEAFDEETKEVARLYASRELIPLLMPCPMHRRAHEKPRGYAGDYRLMTLYFSQELHGETLYGQFLHYVAQHYSLGRTVLERERSMREEVLKTLAADRPVRVLSLASGPALEIQHLLHDAPSLPHRPEFLFIDQDQEALGFAHDSLTRTVTERYGGESPADFTYFQFSIRQILKPEQKEERELMKQKLQGLDLIYSAGLFDYLRDDLCKVLLRRLYTMVRPGGRLFIGNLQRVADTSWMMEYALTWLLVYRDEPTMLRLAEGLEPAPAELRVARDATGNCLFLEVVRP